MPEANERLHRLLTELVRSAGLLSPGRTHRHAGHQVSLTEVVALGELSGDLTQQELGARLGLEKSTVSRLVAGLENRGWLERRRDPANHRFFRLRLTPEGAAAAEAVGADVAEHQRHLLAGMSDSEQAALEVGLGALVRQIHIVPDGAEPHTG